MCPSQPLPLGSYQVRPVGHKASALPWKQQKCLLQADTSGQYNTAATWKRFLVRPDKAAICEEDNLFSGLRQLMLHCFLQVCTA